MTETIAREVPTDEQLDRGFEIGDELAERVMNADYDDGSGGVAYSAWLNLTVYMLVRGWTLEKLRSMFQSAMVQAEIATCEGNA